MKNTKSNISRSNSSKMSISGKAFHTKTVATKTIDIHQRIIDTPKPNLISTVLTSNPTSMMKMPIKTIEFPTHGLSIYKHIIETSTFDTKKHPLDLHNAIIESSTSLKPYTPSLLKSINLPLLSSLECETAKKLKNAGINASLSLPSVQLLDSLKSLSSLSSGIRSTIDNTFSSSTLLKNYSSLIQNHYKHIQKNISNSGQHLKVIDLATKIIQEQLAYTRLYAESNLKISEGDTSSIKLDSTKTVLQYIPVYLGYALRNDSDCNLEEEFFKSKIGKIYEKSKNIVEKIYHINEVQLSQKGEELFKPTNKTLLAASCISSSLSIDKDTFGKVIDGLYMLIYEGSGSAKRILDILDDQDCSTLWDIKLLRTDFRHDIDHGSEKDFVNKEARIGDVYKSLCDKVRPFKPKEWVETHYKLFCNVDAFLDLIIDKISA